MIAFTSPFIALLCVLLSDLCRVNSLGCFTCTSLNGSNPYCRDPFNPVHVNYETKCKQGMDGRVGTFPAKYCTKIKGVRVDTQSEMLVRSCGMESMLNTCGMFRFKEHDYHGCLMSCKANACNEASVLRHVSSCIFVFILSVFVLYTNS
ncbi:uncharacterized protein [Haliotis cracherodii]|uniref:uncharacterized protein n=1 Tax=Haliotis cracherodii TaxID=6455 RepID=UPI0039E8E5BF